MKGLIIPLLIFILGMGFLVSCAKRPVLYPNERIYELGWEVAEQDIDDCIRLAEQQGLKSRTAEKVAKKTAKGATSGAVVGTAVGAVTGRIGKGAAVGAAGGGSAGFMRGIFDAREPDPLHRKFVEKCLRDKGYKIIGWK